MPRTWVRLQSSQEFRIFRHKDDLEYPGCSPVHKVQRRVICSMFLTLQNTASRIVLLNHRHLCLERNSVNDLSMQIFIRIKCQAVPFGSCILSNVSKMSFIGWPRLRDFLLSATTFLKKAADSSLMILKHTIPALIISIRGGFAEVLKPTASLDIQRTTVARPGAGKISITQKRYFWIEHRELSRRSIVRLTGNNSRRDCSRTSPHFRSYRKLRAIFWRYMVLLFKGSL